MFRLNNFILLLILPFSSNVFSTNLMGSISGNSSVVWDNAVSVPSLGGVSASFWSITEPRPTSEWYPGSLANLETQWVTFTNAETGKSFQTLIEWKGVQYNLGKSSSAFVIKTYGDGNVGAGVAELCNNFRVTSQLATIGNNDEICASNIGYTSNNGGFSSPFKFFRTVIDLPNLEQDIQGQEGGRYTLTLDSTPIYFYRSETGVLTYLQDHEQIFVQIEYKAAFITDAKVVSGNGIIHPTYNKGDATVNGSTIYRVRVDGVFPEGVKMTFDTSKNYSLISNSNSKFEIPYNITCQSGCFNSGLIVDEGDFDLAKFPSGEIISDMTSSSEGSLFFELEVSFNQHGNDVISSSYSDQFSVIFEANL
ncbi:hypothetical protein [Vibrio owensii]|uniref:hypothetical protein n=1 Tax=Vibrio owensii TaxID=696485 RepID=UPI0005EFEBAA|nr:hypothetical protein [Vibrio owensii]